MEAAIGEAAERIWTYLAMHTTTSLPALQRGTRLSARLLHLALGWLAREARIRLVQERRGLTVVRQATRRKPAHPRLPGFVAEASLYRSTRPYVTWGWPTHARDVETR